MVWRDPYLSVDAMVLQVDQPIDRVGLTIFLKEPSSDSFFEQPGGLPQHAS